MPPDRPNLELSTIPDPAADPFACFHPVTAAWFQAVFDAPTAPQRQGWPVIARGESALILAPTGTGMANMARRMGVPFREPLISVRTGDTPQRERARFARHPAEILITTPESLYLILTSQAAEALRTVDTVIIDEIHALVPTKRGAHLALSLERLETLTGRRLQRIGLSATQRPLEEVARFLGGVEVQDGGGGAVGIVSVSSADTKPH